MPTAGMCCLAVARSDVSRDGTVFYINIAGSKILMSDFVILLVHTNLLCRTVRHGSEITASEMSVTSYFMAFQWLKV